MDAWVRASILDLAQRHHHVIGHMVSSRLAKRPDEYLVIKIKEKVGTDLQHIRLNVALVGGIVGILLAATKLMLG